jgi:hypothetical protein
MVKALEKARVQPMYAKTRTWGTRPGGKTGEEARDLAHNQRMTLTQPNCTRQYREFLASAAPVARSPLAGVVSAGSAVDSAVCSAAPAASMRSAYSAEAYSAEAYSAEAYSAEVDFAEAAAGPVGSSAVD